jgi:hypothetical protein
MSAHIIKESGWVVKNNNLFLVTKEGTAKWTNSPIYDDIVFFKTEEEANKRIKRIKKGTAVLLDENTPTKKIFSIHQSWLGDIDIDIFEVPTFCKKWCDEGMFYETNNVITYAQKLRQKAINERLKQIEKLQQQIVKLQEQTDEDTQNHINQNLEHLEYVKKIDAENRLKKQKKEERKLSKTKGGE